MGWSSGFKWNNERIHRLKELKIAGLSAHEIAEQLLKEWGVQFRRKQIETALQRHGITFDTLAKDTDIKIYKQLELPMDDYMVSCDYHCPSHSEEWVNRFLFIANKFKIKKNIIIGDLFDYNFIKHQYTEAERDLSKEVFHSDPVIKVLDLFDENILLCGNHERRIGIQTHGMIHAHHLFGLYGKEIWEKKFKFSNYDRMFIGDNWMLTHPRSYSQISMSVARRLAEKYHRNIINSHGHLWGATYERSGNFMCVDLGGMFGYKEKKFDYIEFMTTTHPQWINGFGLFLDGRFMHFGPESNWKFWLSQYQ